MMDAPAAPQPVADATLDAKLNELRAAWETIEERRKDKAVEMKSYRDRIKAAEDQRDALIREPHESGQPAIVLDQCRTLQLKIDGLEIDSERAAERHKRLIDEAEATFRAKLFGEQLPLLLTDGSTKHAEVNPDGGKVIGVTMPDGSTLRVGQHVMIHGGKMHQPGIVLELDPANDPAKHGALVRYDGDDPTPSHVMAHQCHAIPDDDAEPKAARGKRKRKGAETESHADTVTGTIDTDAGFAVPLAIGDHVSVGGRGDFIVGGFEGDGAFVQVKPAKKPRGKKAESFTTPRHNVAPIERAAAPLRLGDRVRLLGLAEHGDEPTDIMGTVEALEDGKAQVRWDGRIEELSPHAFADLARQPKASRSKQARASEPDLPDDGRYDELPCCTVCGEEVPPSNVGAVDGSGTICRTCTGDPPDLVA